MLFGIFLSLAAFPKLERTVFQTGSAYGDRINLRSDVAIVYGFDKSMPGRIKSWSERGYGIHLMTGVAWGNYQDYLYGRWDGVDHQDEAQTRKDGSKVGHGGDVYYMSPGAGYGKYLAAGVRRALENGVKAVHLEEPEFWTFGGYGAGFKREWQAHYDEPWQDPESSPDARWRAAKLMYFLYRRALQQVFDSVQEFNQERGTHVRCYVPTHSLLNYSSWGIVSPESSLARLKGCDGYIAQVWTGTARTPNTYQGVSKERTFETAFLEYGAMQNLVRSTGRGVWYLADPVEDDPDHDWGDYKRNYESTLTASLFQPEVHQYEVMPWPERVFNGQYPSAADSKKRERIPSEYALELQVVINALKDMNQRSVSWECGTQGIGVAVSDSLMFERGGPDSSDGQLNHIYGLAMPFLKRGMPVQPVQLENVVLPNYLKRVKVLLMTYEGMKPLTPDVHDAIAKWVRGGGTLVFVDADTDPFCSVREWWNSGDLHYKTPREDLFHRLGLAGSPEQVLWQARKGGVLWLKRSPSAIAKDPAGARWLVEPVRRLAKDLKWKEKGSLVLRRGPYVIAAGMDETEAKPVQLSGEYVDLFDPKLAVLSRVEIGPGSRHFLVDLTKARGPVIAAAGSVLQEKASDTGWEGTIEGVADAPSVLLLKALRSPVSAEVDGKPIVDQSFDAEHHLLWLRFQSQAHPQRVSVDYPVRSDSLPAR